MKHETTNNISLNVKKQDKYLKGQTITLIGYDWKDNNNDVNYFWRRVTSLGGKVNYALNKKTSVVVFSDSDFYTSTERKRAKHYVSAAFAVISGTLAGHFHATPKAGPALGVAIIGTLAILSVELLRAMPKKIFNKDILKNKTFRRAKKLGIPIFSESQFIASLEAINMRDDI